MSKINKCVKCIQCFNFSPLPVEGQHHCLESRQIVEPFEKRLCHQFSYLPIWNAHPAVREMYKRQEEKFYDPLFLILSEPASEVLQ